MFGAATPVRIRLSDAICTGLQLTEHLQDVAEDYARGRVYLPAADRERLGCPRTGPRGRDAIAGAAATAGVRGRARACAARRGRAARADAARSQRVRGRGVRRRRGVRRWPRIERSGYDVLGGRPRSRSGAAGSGAARRARARREQVSRAVASDDALDAAYRHCEALTRAHAANFYYGIRLLPAPKRARHVRRLRVRPAGRRHRRRR